jgi:hypothetical protein
MQKKQALHCNAELVGAKMKCRNSRRYTVMHKQQMLHCNAEVAELALQCNAEAAWATQ